MWGEWARNLLKAYPTHSFSVCPLLSYLDNPRDIADKLFDGSVASEMPLGEAIVRGILNPPKYVLSVFSYQKDLEKYQRKVRQAKNKVIRDAAEVYLDALRRSLDKVDGLDEIFAKHMTDLHGKYIVFSANADHMREMIGKVPEWFGKVDKQPHIYSAYSDDPATSQAFADFKADNSEHLNDPFSYRSPNGFNLYGWLANRLDEYRTGCLVSERYETLSAIGMVWCGIVKTRGRGGIVSGEGVL